MPILSRKFGNKSEFFIALLLLVKAGLLCKWVFGAILHKIIDACGDF